VPPLRERLGDPNRLAIPLTYPGKRKHHNHGRGQKEGGLKATWTRTLERLRRIKADNSINQSPRVPARYPKATTTRRETGESRETIESRKEQTENARGVPAHIRKSAIFLRCQKADIIVCCIYHAPKPYENCQDGLPHFVTAILQEARLVSSHGVENGIYGYIQVKITKFAYASPQTKKRKDTLILGHRFPAQTPCALNSLCVHSHSSSANASSAAAFVNPPLIPTGS
jgi:hypothetical protein